MSAVGGYPTLSLLNKNKLVSRHAKHFSLNSKRNPAEFSLAMRPGCYTKSPLANSKIALGSPKKNLGQPSCVNFGDRRRSW